MWNGSYRRTVKIYIKFRTDDYFVKMTMCEHKGFTNMYEMLKNMGYISGLMMQAIPYDFRRNIASLNT